MWLVDHVHSGDTKHAFGDRDFSLDRAALEVRWWMHGWPNQGNSHDQVLTVCQAPF
jgi:hypothetical protein